MIARNFIRHPEALALQLCLDLGKLVKWATAEPGCRALRAIRRARAAAIKALPRVRPDLPPMCDQWDAKPAPQWVRDRAAAARKAAKAVRDAIPMMFEQQWGHVPRIGRGKALWRPVGFKYA